MTDFSEFDEFVSCLATVIGESRVPEEVKKNLVGEFGVSYYLYCTIMNLDHIF